MAHLSELKKANPIKMLVKCFMLESKFVGKKFNFSTKKYVYINLELLSALLIFLVVVSNKQNTSLLNKVYS